MLFAVVEQGAPGSDPPANALAPASLDREAMMERLGGAAYVLKGVAANLSAAGLFEAAQTLERLGAESLLEPAEATWFRLSGKRPT